MYINISILFVYITSFRKLTSRCDGESFDQPVKCNTTVRITLTHNLLTL